MDKPPHGAPCNSCGKCCERELCPLGAALFKRWSGPCPALEEGRCGLVQHPERYAPVRAAAVGVVALSRAAAHMIGAGKGCDAVWEGELVNWGFRAWMIRQANHGRARRGLRLWGLGD